METVILEEFFFKIEKSLLYSPQVRFNGYWTSWNNSYITCNKTGMRIFLNFLESSEWNIYEDRGAKVLLLDPNLDMWHAESMCLGYAHSIKFTKL